MGWIDNALMAFAPRVAYQRARYQLAAKVAQKAARSYDAASTGRRTSGWKQPSTSANAETETKVPKLRNVARQLERNNAWARKALSTITTNTVGTGIRYQPKARSKAKVKAAADVWKAWAESTDCDFDGLHDIYGLQSLILRTVARDGECLVRFREVSKGAVPLSLQVLEADFLDTTLKTAENGNRIIQGKEIDDQGRVVAYHLYEQHPGDVGWLSLRWYSTSNRVEAAEVMHVYQVERPGQLRGVSWLAAVELPLNDLEEYEDAQLTKQKIAAAFAAFVHDASGAEDTVTEDEPVLSEAIQPGIIETLPPGKDVTFSDPPSVEGYSDYTRSVLRKVAAGIGVTYETLTGDFSQVNFSSGRMGWIEMSRNIEDWRWKMLIPRFCLPVWARFVQAARIAGWDLSGVTVEVTAPRREMIDPTKEIAAKKEAIRSGQKTLSETLREDGYDPDTVLDEWAEDARKLDERGLVLDCDPRRTTNQGQPRDKAADSTPTDGSGDASP